MTTGKSNLIDVGVDLLHETEKAYLVRNGSGTKCWVPKSQAEYEDEVLTLPEWLAIEKGLV